MATIQRNVQRLLRGGLRQQAPAWLTAMDLIPPSAAKPRYVAKLDITGPLPFEQLKDTQLRHYETQVRKLFKGHRSNSHHSSSKKLRPPKIVFPEDIIRTRFYKQHPLELTRPRELTAPTRVNWSKLLESDQLLTGEHAIQYTLYLIAQGHSYESAYKQACEEFYTARIREEHAEQTANMRRIKEQRMKEGKERYESTSALPIFQTGGEELDENELKLQKPFNYQFWIREESVLARNEKAYVIKQQVREAAAQEGGFE